MVTSDQNEQSQSSKAAPWSLQTVWSLLRPLLALVVVVLGFGIADQVWGQGHFLEIRNLRVVLVLTAPVAIAALGMTLIIITGGIDLSAGTASILCATVLAVSINQDWGIGIAVALALLTGSCCGLANGLLISLLKIPPFIVTLGTMTIYLGLAKQLANSSNGIRQSREATELVDASQFYYASRLVDGTPQYCDGCLVGIGDCDFGCIGTSLCHTRQAYLCNRFQ